MDEAVVNAAREAAFNEATRQPNKLEALVDKALSSRSSKSLEPTKDKVRSYRKEKMRTKAFYLCDGCDKPIHNPEMGFIVHGNVYVADPSCRGGLIGNNFPEVAPGEKIEVTDVKETVFCVDCFMRATGLDKKLKQAKEVQDLDELFDTKVSMSSTSLVAGRPPQQQAPSPGAYNRGRRTYADDQTPMESLRRRQAQQQNDSRDMSMVDGSDDGDMMPDTRNAGMMQEAGLPSEDTITDRNFIDQLSRIPRPNTNVRRGRA